MCVGGGGGGVKLSSHLFFVCVLHSYCLTGTHFMFVFISALSAGKHDASLWSLHWMSTSALKSNITQLCTFLFTFTFLCL